MFASLLFCSWVSSNNYYDRQYLHFMKIAFSFAIKTVPRYTGEHTQVHTSFSWSFPGKPCLDRCSVIFSSTRYVLKHGVILGGTRGSEPPLFGAGTDSPLFEYTKSEILPSKRRESHRIQTVIYSNAINWIQFVARIVNITSIRECSYTTYQNLLNQKSYTYNTSINYAVRAKIV